MQARRWAHTSQSGAVIEELATRHRRLTASAESLTVVHDAGQNSADNHAVAEEPEIGLIGSPPPPGHPDPLAIPRSRHRPADPDRLPGLTHADTTATASGATRPAVLTHSATPRATQSRGLGQTLGKARRRPAEPQARPARGETRRNRDAAQAGIAAIPRPRWAADVITTTLTGDTPATPRLTWRANTRARARLQNQLSGKRILLTNRDTWPVADAAAGHRSQPEAEAGFGQLKDPHVMSFSPTRHWTDANIRVHAFHRVPALAIAHLPRRHAEHPGLRMSARELLNELAGIQETVLLHHDGGKGRPRAQRMLTDMTPTQQRLADPSRHPPPRPYPLTQHRLSNTPPPPEPAPTSGNTAKIKL
jgi:hypothetical protein